ncbi:MAG: aldolase/citrate lyase family protein [Pelagibacterium sp.]|uniref:HpcH/HpaI aldolase family protein n=1 Tax=Pelagibacterium sp. TaxID=1967288 RepID=UPI0032EB25A5
MTARSSNLRETLLSGAQTLGVFLFLGSPDVAEVMAVAGFRVLLVDREHAAADYATALAELRAIRSVSDAFVMVRTRDNSPGAIKPMLDAGFDGIMVADIRTPKEAHAITDAARYAPMGRRGAHFTVSRAAHYGLDVARHSETANQSILVCAMIESRQGLENIDAIAAVEGIDMLFLGPLDLTADYGTFGNLASPELAAALHKAEARITQSGKLLGGAALPGDTLVDLFSRGYSLVTSASDVGILREGALKYTQCK